jgi:hypothetical protein
VNRDEIIIDAVVVDPKQYTDTLLARARPAPAAAASSSSSAGEAPPTVLSEPELQALLGCLRREGTAGAGGIRVVTVDWVVVCAGLGETVGSLSVLSH